MAPRVVHFKNQQNDLCFTVFKGILLKYVFFVNKNYVGTNFVSPMQEICAE